MSVLTNIRQRLMRRVTLHEAYQSVFSTEQGKQVLTHLVKEGYILKSTFVAGDPHRTSLNEGKRLLALSILKFVNKDHDGVIKQIEQEIQQYENQ